MKPINLLGLFLIATGAALAQLPSVTLIANASSYTPPGLPNSGIARGALFVVKGSNLGPATFVVASAFPFQTTIGGTSVNVTVAGQTVAAIMYYAGASQVAAILPSSTLAGTGTLTVTYNGQTSSAAAITVVQNALGIFTVSQSGAGDSIATFQTGGAGYVTPSNAANPGDAVIFWGTGLGPVNFDEAAAAQQSDMTNVPVQAYIGGKTANILFRGRNACCTAVDTIYVQVPTGVTGCAVPVVFVINNVVSNTTSIAIAASGRICKPTNPAYSSVDLSQIFSKPTYSFGAIGLNRTVSTTLPISVGPVTLPGMTTRSDNGSATFLKVTVPPGAIGVGSAVDIASYGSCLVTTFSGSNSSATGPAVTFSYLDAGSSIGVSGPGGAKMMSRQTFGNIIGYFAQFDSTGTYLAAGQYSITGTGGPDVGGFSVQLTLPSPLTWTNQSTTTSVTRSSGVTVTWTGGDPQGYVVISGSSFVGATAATIVGATFTCSARTSDGTFTVPAIVLLALPASGSMMSNGIAIPTPGTLSVASYSAAGLFQASGLDYGVVTAAATNTSEVTYQ